MNILFKPFFDLRDKMHEKYGVDEIPYYVCRGIDKHSPISSIGNGMTYVDYPISKFGEYYKKLLASLNDGYVVKFDWDGKPRWCIFTRQESYSMPYHAHFTSSDDYTWLGIGFDPEKNLFYTYCNVVLTMEHSIAEAKRRMSNIEIKKIDL